MREHLIFILLAGAALLGCAAPGASTRAPADEGWRQLELLNYRGALTQFELGLGAADDAALHAGRARALYMLGRFDEARAAYGDALARERDEPQWHMGLALVELARGDVRAAVAACDAVIALDPASAKAFYNRGCARLRAEQLDTAREDFAEAIRLDPDYAEAFDGRGVALASAGRFDEALADFRRAALLAPLASAHGNAAAAHFAQGDVQRALAELNVAVRLERSNPVHYTNRGRIYLELERPGLAAAEFEQALILAPATPEVSQLLARARDTARAHQGVPQAAAASTAHDE